MEQVTKKDGVLYYGEQRCGTIDDVYRRFRDEYNSLVGRAAYKRLSRVGSRSERIHEFGFVFDTPSDKDKGLPWGKHTLKLLGLVCGSYIWDLDASRFPDMEEQELMSVLDSILEKGSKMMRKTGKTVGSGRNDKRLNKRYR